MVIIIWFSGIGNLREHTKGVLEHKESEEAAIKIQAAFRGHTVRQNLAWKSPPRPGGKVRKEVSISSEDSILSDSTLTEIDDAPKSKHIGDSMSARIYHASPSDTDDSLHIDKPGNIRPLPKYKWDKPAGDQYNVMNIYSQRCQRGNYIYMLDSKVW